MSSMLLVCTSTCVCVCGLIAVLKQISLANVIVLCAKAKTPFESEIVCYISHKMATGDMVVLNHSIRGVLSWSMGLRGFLFWLTPVNN